MSKHFFAKHTPYLLYHTQKHPERFLQFLKSIMHHTGCKTLPDLRQYAVEHNVLDSIPLVAVGLKDQSIIKTFAKLVCPELPAPAHFNLRDCAHPALLVHWRVMYHIMATLPRATRLQIERLHIDPTETSVKLE